jgi:hypothetical protein
LNPIVFLVAANILLGVDGFEACFTTPVIRQTAMAVRDNDHLILDR